ncbi:MAG: HDOD domain-containing protein [Bryobacterales bacterium]|nr:HDOD domain-containing protein [Bryobacterales bacterium]MEB2362519.1 HDOD domain-containing protein [Bryobacterales bacterium]
MDVFVARQPIYERSLKVYAYELLFRQRAAANAQVFDGNAATSSVIANGMFLIGARSLLGGRPAFINFTEDLLLTDIPSILPPRELIVEVLETVSATAETINACRKLKTQGYLLALDDFTGRGENGALADLADIIKVDFLQTTTAEQEWIAKTYGKRKLLLAEKVETIQDFEQAHRMGYAYFQGYFLARPQIIESRQIPPLKINYLRLLDEIRQPEIDYHRIATLIGSDVSLSYNFLRYMGSAAFSFSRTIVSVRQGLSLLGDAGVRKWVAVIVLANLAMHKPRELMVTALVRGRLCELVAPKAGMEHRKSELFLMGLFSLLDAILERPMKTLLEEMPLAADVRSALLGEPSNSPIARLHCLLEAYERGQWDVAARLSARLGISETALAALYLDAVRWAEGSGIRHARTTPVTR